MFARNQLQASNPGRRPDRGLPVITRAEQRKVRSLEVSPFAQYPEVPAAWPNRAVRRAIKGNKTSRIPGVWLNSMVRHPGLRVAIKGL